MCHKPVRRVFHLCPRFGQALIEWAALPTEAGANDESRCRAAHIPRDISFCDQAGDRAGRACQCAPQGEPCLVGDSHPRTLACTREAVREALTGEHAGQPWNRGTDLIPGADAPIQRKAIRKGATSQVPARPAWS
ncbi:hypothetical protein MPLSOD_410008 [Mesorhizobium sp. SOD10]|nr:hypothetical protein MPLSOD_410008 [Mesorhizobium sp. SOD10]